MTTRNGLLFLSHFFFFTFYYFDIINSHQKQLEKTLSCHVQLHVDIRFIPLRMNCFQTAERNCSRRHLTRGLNDVN
jgi:hypothetical protein